MELVTGVITFDWSGQHYLDTFEGRFLVEGATLSSTWVAIMNEKKGDERQELESISVAGLLARGRTVEIDGKYVVRDLSYLIKGEEIPERQNKEKSS